MRAVEDLRKEAGERRGKQSGRLAAYRSFLAAYFDEAIGDSGANVVGSNADGRPVLRLQQTRSDLSGRRGAPNLLAPMIDDIVSMRGIMPSSSVIPESHNEADMAASVRRTRGLRQQHDQSNMDIQLPEATFYLACLGDAVLTLDPLLPGDAERENDPFRPPGVYVRALHPGNCFPKFRMAIDPRELEDLYCIWDMDRQTVKDSYGFEPQEERVEVIVYYSRSEKQIIVGERRVAGIDHNLGFCPAQWVGNKITDGRQAQSDIARAVELHEEMKSMYHVYSDSLILSVYPMIKRKNAYNVAGDQIEVGPGAVVDVTGDGDVTLMAPAANPRAAEQLFNTTFDNIMKIVGIAPVRIEGQIDRSNVSARSVTRQQEGMHNRFALANTVLGYHWERINSKILLMLYRIPELREAEMSTWGVDQEGSYHDVFTGNDMGGWHRNSVKWDVWAGADKHERLVMALQLLKEGLVGGKRVLEEYGDDDPERTLEEAKSFMHEKMGEMAAQQPPAPGPGGPPGAQLGGPPGAAGPPGPTDAAAQGVALGAGALGGGAGGGGPSGPPMGMVQPPPAMGMPGPPGPQLPGFGPQAAAPSKPGLGTPLIVPDVGREMDEAIQSVPLHGQILARHPIVGGVRVEVSDHRDIGPLKVALRPVAVKLAGESAKVEVKVPQWYVQHHIKPNGRKPVKA